MGRRDYLTRLALGRSPFQGPSENAHRPAPVYDSANGLSANEQGVQQYAASGRPVNAATDIRNARMRHAQNSTLALVGVVERESISKTDDSIFQSLHGVRPGSLRAEHGRGEALEDLAAVIRLLPTWAIDCFLQRVEIGFYSPKEAFADVLRREWRAVYSSGLKGAIFALLPGGTAYCVFFLCRMCCTTVVEFAVKTMSEIAWNKSKSLPKREQERIDGMMHCLENILKLTVDVTLLPIGYYATAQQLGLAPTFPLLPPLVSLLPWHPTSVNSFGWKPLLHSPASLLLAHVYLKEGIEDSTHFDGNLSSFRHPGLHGDFLFMESARFRQEEDLFGWILNGCYRVREQVLHWLGLDMMPQKSEPQYELERSTNRGDRALGASHSYRSTALAWFPVRYLATRIDELLLRLVVLPFDTIVLRAVALSYLESPLPKTYEALAAAPWPTTTLRLGWLRFNSLDWPLSDICSYTSKLGLSLALHVAVETAVFGGVYAFVR